MNRRLASALLATFLLSFGAAPSLASDSDSRPAPPPASEGSNPPRAEHVLVVIAPDPTNQSRAEAHPLNDDGHPITVFDAEVSRTEHDMELGLMFRTELPPGKAMWFQTPPAQPIAVWMKNTFIPLDIVFVRNGRISSIYPNGKPFDLTAMPSNGPVDGFLEIRGGEAQRLALSPGMVAILKKTP